MRGNRVWEDSDFQRRWNTMSTMLGFVVWSGAAIVSLASATFLDQIDLLIFFGIAVIAPLTIALIDSPPRSRLHARLYASVVFLQPVTAALSGVSLVLPVGTSAGGLLAGNWLALTGLMALVGLGRLERRLTLGEWCIIAGLVYSLVSGIWLVIHQTWGAFLTFDETIVLLTAAHFCYIGLGALIIAGMVGRYHNSALYRVSALGMMASPLLVALGITLTSFGGSVSPVEKVGTVMLAGSVLLLSLVILFRVRVEKRAARWLLRLSAGSLFLTMGLALAYAIGRLISIPDMVQWHGWLNAAGFAFLGLLGWRIE